MVGRQFHYRRIAAQLLFPEGELFLEHVALKPLPLPDGEIGVANRQLRQRCGSSLDKACVKVGQFMEKDFHRPLIGNDVVDVHDKQMFPWRQPQ